MNIIGYIVQHSNEDEYTVYTGYKKLFRFYSEALENAKEFFRAALEQNEQGHHPFLTHTPTKKNCDTQGSVVVFESPQLIVWIDAVIE